MPVCTEHGKRLAGGRTLSAVTAASVARLLRVHRKDRQTTEMVLELLSASGRLQSILLKGTCFGCSPLKRLQTGVSF